MNRARNAHPRPTSVEFVACGQAALVQPPSARDRSHQQASGRRHGHDEKVNGCAVHQKTNQPDRFAIHIRSDGRCPDGSGRGGDGHEMFRCSPSHWVSSPTSAEMEDGRCR